MTDLWGPIDSQDWRRVPCVVGRVADEADVSEGRAVFYVDGESAPHPMQIPTCALQRMEDGSTEQVVVIQAEQGPESVILGVRFLEGGNGICTLGEVELLPAGFEG